MHDIKKSLKYYRISINIKTICAYEAITGRPFLSIETEEDIKYLFYVSLAQNNEEFKTMTFSSFLYLIEEENDIVTWLAEEYERISRYISQFKGFSDIFDGGSNDNTDTPQFYISEAAAGLIINGMDAHYVMYEMELWEMPMYYAMKREKDRERLTESRLWTYFQILPHVGKKLSSPETLISFPWEKEKKIKELDEEKTKGVVDFLSKNNKKK